MDKKSKKVYDKAMNYYEKGKINKALELCEAQLSESLKNSAILNLKGLLLYQKGELNAAITVWKINKDFNNDAISKNYIKGMEDDRKRLELYNLGESELKKLKIDSAMQMFDKCAQSDFNSIKVNTALALCYQKKGDFKKAQYYVNKALSIDEDAVAAQSIKKELKEIGMYDDGKGSSKKVIVATIGMLFIILIGIGTYSMIGKWKLNEKVEIVKQVEETKKEETRKEEINSEVEKQKEETNIETEKEAEQIKKTEDLSNAEKKIVDLDNEKLSGFIANNDIEQVYNEVKGIKEEQLKDDDKNIYKQSINLLQNQGIEKFYQDGQWFFNEGNYDRAEIELSKAYEYCDGNYLKEHIIYYRSTSFLKKGNSDSALKGYEEYYNLYPNGSYIQDSLYQLILMYNDIDKQKSKNYANILINNYPDSIFVNDYVMKIINE